MSAQTGDGTTPTTELPSFAAGNQLKIVYQAFGLGVKQFRPTWLEASGQHDTAAEVLKELEATMTPSRLRKTAIRIIRLVMQSEVVMEKAAQPKSDWTTPTTWQTRLSAEPTPQPSPPSQISVLPDQEPAVGSGSKEAPLPGNASQ